MIHLVYVVNVDWYFRLHWLPRAVDSLRNGFRVSLVCPQTSAETIAHIESLGIAVYPLRMSRSSINPLRELKTCIELFRSLKRLDADLVHAITIKPHLYAGWFARRNRKKLVATVPGLGWLYSTPGATTAALRWILSTLLRGIHQGASSRVVFENGDDLARFVDAGIVAPHKSVLIRGAGVDLDRFHPAQIEAADGRRILFASRLLESKGLALLVNACQRLRDANFEVELAVAGIIDEDQRDAIPMKRIRQWADEGRIDWLGQVDDMPEAIRRADLVALPTRYGEGIPRILIEAASCGKPMIATDVPGCREIVKPGFNGILVPADADAETLAGAIRQLLEDRAARKRYADNSRKLAIEEFADRVVLEKTRDLYRELLEQGQAGNAKRPR